MGIVPTHHFYLVESDGNDIEKADALLKDLHFTKEASKNFFVFEYQSFGIDDARKVRAQALLKGQEETRAFVISFFSITHDASQALLKILEESPEGVLFLVFVPSLFQLPETIISRAHVIPLLENTIEESYEKIAEIFFTKSVSDRFAHIEKLLKGTKDEKPLRNKGLVLLHAIEKYAHEKKEKLPESFFENYMYMMQPTSSPKILLEALAGSI